VYIVLGLTVLVLLLFVVLQLFFRVPVIAAVSSGYFGAILTVVILLVILVIGAALFRLLQKCNYSIACLLLGGQAGVSEQPIENMKRALYKESKLAEDHLRQGQLVTLEVNPRTTAPATEPSSASDWGF